MTTAEIIKIIEEILSKGSFSYLSIEPKESDISGCVKIDISSDNPHELLGKDGENLLALSHLVKQILYKEDPERKENFFIDIGDFQTKKIQSIQHIARTMTERAKSFKRDIELNPMTSYERMIVHSTLADEPSVETSSEGYGKGRRVIIKYIETEDSEF